MILDYFQRNSTWKELGKLWVNDEEREMKKSFGKIYNIIIPPNIKQHNPLVIPGTLLVLILFLSLVV